MTDTEATIARLSEEHEELQFGKFAFDDAWAIGQDLVAEGRRTGLPVAIDISLNGQTLFHAALPGSAPDNDQWIIRKNRVVQRFHRSSFYIANLLKQKGKTMEEAYGLATAEYAPFGGAAPIRVRGVGVVGTVTVSGLPDHEDHRMVAEALRRHLASRT
ncbi:MAG: heme-degrading domain-containing protein [Spirochaetaceae bacterium]|nr:heme-degrading domain-containing protein [Spirochaetaceae bacterium]